MRTTAAQNKNTQKEKRNAKKGQNRPGFSAYWLGSLGLILAGIIAYAKGFSFDFVNLDDVDMIVGNFGRINELSDIFSAFSTNLFFQQVSPYYRPLFTASLFIDAAIGGQSPAAFHATNIILHSLTVCLLWFFLLRVPVDRRLAYFGTLLFAVHPLFANAVLWVVGRADIMAGLFTLTALISLDNFTRRTEGGRWPWFAVHLLGFAAAVFSKEVALVAPAVFFLYMLYLRRESLTMRNILSLGVCWTVIAGLFLFLRAEMLSGLQSDIRISPLYIFSNWATIPEFIGKLFLPAGISVLPKYSMLNTIAGLLVLAGLGYALYRASRAEEDLDSPRIIMLGLLWFLLFTLPGMFTQVVKENEVWFDYLECRAYLPSMGIILALCALVPKTVFEGKGDQIRYVALGLAALFCFVTWSEASDYRDPVAFYSAAAGDFPNPVFYNNLALAKKDKGDMSGAAGSIEKAIALDPSDGRSYNNRGTIFKEQGNMRDALADFDKAISLDPKDVRAYTNRGNIAFERGDYAAAIKDFDRAILINPHFALAFNSRGSAKLATQDYEGAVRDYSAALRIQPDYPEVYFNRGLAKMNLKDMQGALRDFDACIAVQPKFVPAWSERGKARMMTNNAAGACDDWRMAISLGDRSAAELLQSYCR